MSEERILSTMVPTLDTKAWRTYLPFPLELELCACPICSSRRASALMRFDQFGFPVGSVECEDCGFIFTNPRPTERYMRTFYQKYFWFFFQGCHKVRERFFRRQHTREWALLRATRCAPYLSEAKSILEIGSGSGLFLNEILKAHPGIRAAGIEPDSEMAGYSRNILHLDVYNGFFQSYPSDSRFDAIVLFHVIEHLFDFTGLFEFVRDHLVPGGLVIVEAPNVDGDWKTIYMIQFSHLHIFSPRTISNLLLKNGFEVLRCANLENELDESNLFVVGRLTGTGKPQLSPPDPEESRRVRERFRQMPTNRALRILRSWIRLIYFGIRR